MLFDSLQPLTAKEHAALENLWRDIVVAGKRSSKLRDLGIKRGRTNAKYCDPDNLEQTGAASVDDCKLLYQLAKHIDARKVIEIGTWFGTTAHALALSGAKVYTCDKNDVVVDVNKLAIFYHGPSIKFWKKMAKWGHKVDLVWADARLTTEDIKAMLPLFSGPIRFAVHDYDCKGKGWRNMRALETVLGHSVDAQTKGNFAWWEHK